MHLPSNAPNRKTRNVLLLHTYFFATLAQPTRNLYLCTITNFIAYIGILKGIILAKATTTTITMLLRDHS